MANWGPLDYFAHIFDVAPSTHENAAPRSQSLIEGTLKEIAGGVGNIFRTAVRAGREELAETIRGTPLGKVVVRQVTQAKIGEIFSNPVTWIVGVVLLLGVVMIARR